MTLRIRPEARADMQTAVQWYEVREPGRGLAFLDDVEAVFRRIEQGPARYPVVHQGLRRALAQRFPFAIYFHQVADDIIIFGVLHQRRDRSILSQRLDRTD